MSFLSIINLLTFLAKIKLKFLLLIIFMILKLIWKKVLNLCLALYTLFLAFKQEALKEFIEKNLNIDFIQPTLSLYSVLVLFVKKKDGSLYLCVDFCGLNHIFKKDCYPLLLISNLLNLLYKAWIYSKIDLCHVYYLVHIADSNEWKTVFRTYYRSFEWSVIFFSLINAPVAF